MEWYDEGRKEPLYESLKGQLSELQRQAKFGSNAADAEKNLLQFKREINDGINRSIQMEQKFKWAMIIVIVVAFILNMIVVSASDSDTSRTTTVITIIGAGAAFVCYHIKKASGLKVDAYAAFDADYFDGEILYKRKNGIAL